MSEPIQSIAQNNYILHNIDAKKLYVQEPLFTANSGDAVYVGWRPDETVLWSGSFTNEASGMPLTEAADNFEKLKFIHYWNGNDTWVNWAETIMPVTDDYITLSNITQINNNGAVYFSTNVIKFETTAHNKLIHIAGYRNTFKNENPSTTDITHITKVIGINRKENA